MQKKEFGIILANLGTPDSPTPNDVGKYLNEFLMDPYVLQMPWPLRAILVKILIVPRRKKDSAHAYSTVWTKEGSPLLISTVNLAKKVEEYTQVPVEVGMRYGNPSMASAIKKIKEKVKKILVFPLYPQEAASTTETLRTQIKDLKCDNITIAPTFYDESFFIESMAQLISPHLAKGHLLFSYHGLPLSHVKKMVPGHCQVRPNCCDSNDKDKVCYSRECFATSKAIAKRLSLKREQYTLSFQSRLGRDPWLGPSTNETLMALPEKGIKKLIVAFPGFTNDCLETLEEIAMQGKETFFKAGGESFTALPCLNDETFWAKALSDHLKNLGSSL